MLGLGCIKWLSEKTDGTITKWPPREPTFEEMSTFLKKQVDPLPDWIDEPCTVVKTYSNFLSAHLGLKHRLEAGTDFQTETELGIGKRKRRKTARFISDDSEEEDDVEVVKKKLMRPSLANNTSFQFLPSSSSNAMVQVSSKSTREVKNQKVASIVRKNRGTKASSFENFKELLKMKKSAIAGNILKKSLEESLEGSGSGENREVGQVENQTMLRKIEEEKERQKQEEERKQKLKQEEERKKKQREDERKRLEEDRKRLKLENQDKERRQEEGRNIKKVQEDKNIENSKDNSLTKLKEFQKTIDEMMKKKFGGNDSNKEKSETPQDSEKPDTLYELDFDNSNDSWTDTRISTDCQITISDEEDKSSSKDSETEEDNSSDKIINKETGPLTITESRKVTTAESPKFTAFERRVLLELSELNQKVEQVMINQTKLTMHLLPGERVIRPHGMPSIPVKDETELNDLEKYLKTSENVTNLAIMLSNYVSKERADEYKSAMRVLPHVLSNSVASMYSFAGRKQKKCFSDLKIWTAIKGAIISKIEDTDLRETEKAASVWLKDAPYRCQVDGTSRRQGKSTTSKSS